MFRRNRSTRSGGIPLPDDPFRRRRQARAASRRTVRAVVELVRSRRGWRTCRR